MFKLSPSRINLFIDCKRCFWLTLHEKWKRPPSIFPSLPSGMDKVLKEHFDRFMEKGELPPELKEIEDCKDCKLFDDKEKLDIWRNNFKGISYYDEERGVFLFGAIDNILVKGDKLIVLDYKTRGYPCKDDTHEHYRMQMDLYNYLLRKNGYKTEDFTFLLFYHPVKVLSSGEVVFNSKLIKIDVNVDMAEKVFFDAVDCLNKDIPEDGCEWCVNVE